MTARNRWLIGLALFAVYVIWGSTYLALRYLVEEFPPFIGNGIRFVVAGLAMFVFLRHRGAPPPSGREWWSAAQIGAFLMMGGVGLVALAEARGVGSGLAATAVAAMPLWAALWSGLFGRWPNRLEWLGLAVGLTGVVILSQEGDFSGNSLGITLMIVAPISWAFGSVWSQRIPLPTGAMATALEMTTGGVILLVVGFVRGERFDTFPALDGWLALLYLITLGSIVAFSAYMYLLNTVRPALATSYAYVNPVVAVLLGVTIGSEVLSGQAVIALPLILGGVALVAAARDRGETGVSPVPQET
ncbi:MAG: drug/metabolite exporter YedA [Acidimicrobiia bacterium]|nr:drug/metabolite exporter YedA [Acidimicrobiia bacterium]MBT8193594.1 drug/metabolite exporter YedA [Acidimicrobiia bacterium]NNF87177.1 drug/metabolite exporter YedA [Acidimicrobiia bacterium]NNL13624.1 drug/metabolite exporter YedA [Acidimicrobiia bacterium]NNL97594.1 drug/metabolite exporter YedA [Acidimicrobiia bacterium]